MELRERDTKGGGEAVEEGPWAGVQAAPFSAESVPDLTILESDPPGTTWPELGRIFMYPHMLSLSS